MLRGVLFRCGGNGRWRAAVAAADRALALYGYEEAAGLLCSARSAQALDPRCGAAQRYQVVMAHARACRLAGDRDGQLDAVDRACRAADELGDAELLGRAAVGTADGSVWTIRDRGVVHPPAVDALRRVLRALPEHDSDLRCRALLTLAGELHYAPARRERDALAEEGLAMSRRIGDPALLAWAATTAFVATWQPVNADRRWRLIDAALADESRGGGDRGVVDEAAWVHLRTFRAVAGLETGRIAEMERDVAEAWAGAERLRLGYPLFVLTGLQTPWLAMRGRFAEAEALLAEGAALAERTALPAKESFGLLPLFVRLWQGRAAEFLPVARALFAAVPDLSTAMLLLVLARTGHADEAGAVLDTTGWVPDGGTWSGSFDLSVAAHAAYVARRPALAAAVYRELAPLAGRVAAAGSGGAIGPVDAYLALAAAATGERDLATRHADAAAALAAAWDLPVFARWLTDLRSSGDF
ncbi:hypothetical protein ABZS66_60800 [Dactylosporangium sp. NPDC005572]|uniref:hypothetical protein n=1 Tax=Dactylosporangium sp. NPDC005572 TaxID=3156889 RepID=UPI0033AAC7AD